MTLTSRMIGLVLGLALAAPALAQKAPFDLDGPALKVTVTRAAEALPIGEAPDLAPGDVLAIRPDLPPAQAAHYVLVVVFLRGATNPPPKDWFFALETWEHGGHGLLRVTVPAGAQQALVFLAPHTEGDFDTLRGAVRGRPGAFVRATQDLGQLGLDRGRLNTWLEAVRRTERDDPANLEAVSTALSRTLGIKLDTACFQKTPDLQAPCLMKDQDSLVLDDQANPSLVQALSSGASADLMTQLGAAPQIGGGAYSPYVGAVLDIARLLDSLRTAHYQYVPALEATQGDELRLRLNTAPSFGATKSVLVAALPPIQAAQLPNLHPTDPAGAYCLQAAQSVLAVEGAPLAFSTGFARDMAVGLKSRAGETFEVPARADPEKGGFVVDTSGLAPDGFGPDAVGTLHGRWGFAPFEGPAFHFQIAAPGLWRVSEADRAAIVAGHGQTIRLTGGAGACVTSVTLETPSAPPAAVGFKVGGPREIALDAPFAHAAAGQATLRIASLGLAAPDAVAAEILAEETRMDRFEIHAGDAAGELTGQGLAAVTRLTLGGVRFTPREGAAPGEALTLTAPDDRAPSLLAAGRRLTATVALNDGRTLRLPVTVLPARPAVSLIAESVSPSTAAPAPRIQIAVEGGPVVPRGEVLTFSVRAEASASDAAREAIEVATADGAFTTRLVPGGGLTREDAHVAVASLDTARAFGPSAFGPLRFRLVDARGASDWVDLAVLARLPRLEAVKCPPAPAAGCLLTGSDLFLLQAVASGPSFEDAATVPEGFPGGQLDVPRPRDGKLYLKLRDDPSAVAVARLPARPAKGRGAT